MHHLLPISRKLYKSKQDIGRRDPIERSYHKERPLVGTDKTPQNQAASLYKAYKQHFLLDEQALRLIQNITGVDTFILKLKKVITEKYRDEYERARFEKTMLRDLCLKVIQAEIMAREKYNRRRLFGKKSINDLKEFAEIFSKDNEDGITFNGNLNEMVYDIFIRRLDTPIKERKNTHKNRFWPKNSTYHLTYVKDMLEYYRDARADIRNPQERLSQQQLRVEKLSSHFISGPKAKSGELILRFTKNIENLWSFIGKNRKLKQLLKIHNSKSWQMAEIEKEIKFDLEDIANRISHKAPIVSRASDNKEALIHFDGITSGNTYTKLMEDIAKLHFPDFIDEQTDVLHNLYQFIDVLKRPIDYRNSSLLSPLTNKEKKMNKLMRYAEKLKNKIANGEAKSLVEEILEKVCFNQPIDNELLNRFFNCNVADLFHDFSQTDSSIDPHKIWKNIKIVNVYNAYTSIEMQKQSLKLTPASAIKNVLLQEENKANSLAVWLCDATYHYVAENMKNNGLIKKFIEGHNEEVNTEKQQAIKDFNNVIELIEYNKIVLGQTLYNLKNFNEPIAQTSRLISLSTICGDSKKMMRERLLRDLTNQLTLLEVYRETMAKFHKYYMHLKDGKLSENDAFIDFYQRFIAYYVIGDDRGYEYIQQNIAQNINDMKVLAEMITNSKQAIKFFAGQASYKLRSVKEQTYHPTASTPNVTC